MEERKGMNFSSTNKNDIREYLLGRLTTESALSEIEELLFVNDEFCAEVQAAEDEIVNDYVFGRLNEQDTSSFEKTLLNNPERKLSVDLANALKEKARAEVSAKAAEKAGFIEGIRAFFKQPQYAGGFALILIVVVAFSVFFTTRRNTNDLAALQNIYKDRRHTDSRISGFDHAPRALDRGNDMEEEDEFSEVRQKLSQQVKNNPSADSYHSLGIFYLLTDKKYEKAVKELERAAAAEPFNAGFHNDLGSAYFELGKDGSQKTENLAKAIGEFSRALELDPALLEALFNKSLALQELRQIQQAKESWNLYLQKDPSSKWAQEARKNLEYLENLQSNLKSKDRVLEDFLTAYRKPDGESAWKINSQTRDVYGGVWLPDQLSRRYIRAKLKDDIPEAVESKEALNHIGNLERERNADFFVSDLSAALVSSEPRALNRAFDVFDRGLLLTGTDYSGAHQAFEESKYLFKKARNPLGEKIAEFWIMQVLSSLDRPDEALRMGDELIDFAAKKNYKWFRAAIVYYAGTIYFTRTNLSRAMENYQAAMADAKEIGDTLLEQRSSISILETLLETGEFKKALNYQYPAADEIYYNSYQAKWRNTYFTASALLKLKIYSAAAEFAAESLFYANASERSRNIVSSSILLDEAKAGGGKADDALALVSGALRLTEEMPESPGKGSRQAWILIRRGNLKNLLERFDEALVDFDTAITLLGKAESTVDVYWAHRGRLICYKSLNRPENVSAELDVLLLLANKYRHEILNDESRQAFFENEQAVFDIAIENSLDHGDVTGAFQRAEGSKARSLLDLIGLDPLQKEVYKVAEPYPLDEIRSKMPPNTQIVEYAIMNNRLAAWIISGERHESVDLKIDSDHLNNLIREFASLNTRRNAASPRRAVLARELHQALVEPISQYLDPAKGLVIVPDKKLYYVPFDSLLDAHGRYLIQQHAISYSPSSTIFIARSKKAQLRKGDGTLLAVGNPTFDRQDYPQLERLDSAETEVRQIAAMFTDSRVLSEEDATKEKFLRALPAAGAVHFAGHYLSNPEAPGQSKLVFAGAGFKGDLRMSELAGLKLSGLNLVVLSACETGMEDVLEGEGLISASRAFLAAGASIVVASQWKADSDATEKLMISFHRNRLQKGMNSAEALRQAQLEMLGDKNGQFTSPFYWAAFNVIGGLEN